MPRTLRALNALTALATLASAVAVLGSNLTDPAYHAHYRDAYWFVVLYGAFYALVIYAFVFATPLAPPLSVVKALGAYVFLVIFPDVGQSWMAWTPGRYVYQLFDWGPGAKIGLFAFVFLGRGAWNTVNAFALTREWWFGLRARRPLLGRLLTVVPVAITVFCVWAFLALVRIDNVTFSSEAHEVARLVLAGLDCADVRAKNGTTTTDVRQQGDRRYDVSIQWGCAETRVLVRAPDGKLGTASDPRPECCTGA
ncbi:MAG: hypothetical protein ACREQL_13155 [Candidatus Binatia bacterium]